MKMRKLLMLIAFVGLVFGMMTGCGGGSSDGGDSGGTTPAAGLDSDKVNKTATQMADTLGCDYTTSTAAQSTTFNVALSYKAVEAMKTTLAQKPVLKEILAVSGSTEVTETPGSCGGTLVTTTVENADGTGGTIDLVFNNYCDSDTLGVATTLNGSVQAVVSETTTSMTITASTKTPLNIKATNPNTNEKTDVTIDLQGGEVLINVDTNGNLTAIKLTAASVQVSDNITGEVCTATNVVANIDMATQATTFNANVNCSVDDTGTIKVSGTADASGQVNVEVTDENGKKGTLTSTGTEGVFNVNFDGAALGTMDCSMVNVPGQV